MAVFPLQNKFAKVDISAGAAGTEQLEECSVWLAIGVSPQL
jgi:hypothetical protein